MMKRIRIQVVVALLAFGVSLPAHASPPCLAPEPTCALVLIGVVVTSIVSEEEEENDQDRQVQAGPKHAERKGNADGTRGADDHGRKAWRL